MKNILIVCRHPESHHLSWEILRNITQDDDFSSVTVYGVQNITSNKSRALPSCRFIDTGGDENRLDIDLLNAELTNTKYDIVLIMHAINIVATIMTSIRPFIDDNESCRIVAYCDVSRVNTPAKFFQIFSELKDQITICTPSQQGYAEFKRNNINDIIILPPCLTHVDPISKEVVEHTKQALKLKGCFTILSLGRMDTSIFMYVNFLARQSANSNFKLILPIEQGTKEQVMNLFINEMSTKCPDRDTSQSLVLMSDIGHMAISDICTLMSSCNVVVHANPITDYNYLAEIAAMMGIQQIAPDNDIHKDIIVSHRVPCNFEFCSFDDYGGKIMLSSPKDFSKALHSSLDGKSPKQSTFEDSFPQWKKTLIPYEAPPVDQLQDLRDQLNKIMDLLATNRGRS